MTNAEESEDRSLPKYQLLVNERDLVFFDCEFTGLRFDHEIVEIGFVKAKARTFEIVKERSIKLKAKHIENADPTALEIIGYDPEEWEREGVDMKEGLEEFLRYTKDALIVGHNVSVDLIHLEKAFWDYNLKANYFYKPLDTFSLGWLELRDNPALTNFSLRELASYFAIDRGQAHRGIDDARTTYQVFLKLIGK
ncbi:MAG: 3'-5' exonuclease [Patescibacteria group bacterium]